MLDTLKQIGELLISAGAIAAAVTAVLTMLAVLTKKPWTWWKHVKAWFDQQAATSAAVTKTKQDVAEIKHTLFPNGGTSLADEIHRQGAQLVVVAACMNAMCDVVEECVFMTDSDGQWVRVNRTLSLAFRCPITDLMGMGWVSLIRSEDRDGFMREWHLAIADRRAFDKTVRMHTLDGQLDLEVRILSWPTPGNPEIAGLSFAGRVKIERAGGLGLAPAVVPA